ncbi:hypothetical protein I316_07401 [Kwoniella heveanensis BCC8398]|uniref:Uncharacterized protein n=1 Tax=Kwoniella heveanensis BCC8398 TaxID=1296120 RepID=A0A1B9GIT1_9TREE|nr:hypothetical protein I316_07401 [Kwoniella heveanensis BCC8398]
MPPSPRRKNSRHSNPAQMAPSNPNGQPHRPQYQSGIHGTPPMVNGRRMTSNPIAPGQGPNLNGPPGGGQNYHPSQHTPQQRVPSNSSPIINQGPNPNQNRSQSNFNSPNANANANANFKGNANGNEPPSALTNTTSYPWMVRPLLLQPNPNSPPQAQGALASPFPRYGLSVPAFPSHSGHMLIFGGLVHERVRNDLWSMDIKNCSTLLVQTRGDAPMPRVGHASAMADRIMIVWGGDTKVNVDDPQDEGLYILDLRSQEWTKVPVARGPVGRYGHAVCLIEGKFYVFGGQADGAFMNDLWMYDLKQLSGSSHRWEQIRYAGPPPPSRTGHILVAGNNGKLYLFGGTDGNYHYNDTWAFDLVTRVWTELSCIGYIPLPREGHAAAIVDDTIYVFGGRDVKGKDLGDLAAFKLSNHRWYMFQNMGPSPTPRSGHAMVAASGKIFIVGGEANQALTEVRDDPNMIHILDTSKIKYPPDNVPPRNSVAPTSMVGGLPSMNNNPNPSHNPNPSSNPAQPNQPNAFNTGTPQQGRPSINGPTQQQQQQSEQSPPKQVQETPRSAQAQAPNQPRQQQGQPSSHAQAAGQSTPRANGMPPQRPRREGDEEYRRAMSPVNGSGPASPNNSTNLNRVTSPTQNGPASPPSNPKNGFNASVLGTRSPSPRLRMAEADRPAPPPDAFYYGRSPTTTGFGGRPSSLSGNNDLIRELKNKDAEVEASKKREMALKVILARAVQQGFVAGDEGDLDLPDQERSEEGEDKDKELISKLTDALVRLKHEKAAIQTEMVSQTRSASERAMEAERLRRGALQEAAFYRAKIATLESNSPIDLARIEKERIIELEKQLTALTSSHVISRKQLETAQEAAENARSLHSSAAEREAETLKRAEEAEEAHREAIEEIEQLHHKATTTEQNLREHTEKLITLSSTVQQREAERDQLQTQLEEAITARDENIGLIEQAQAAISAAGLRTSEMEAMYVKANGRVSTLEEELAEVKAELEVKTRDAELAEEKFREVENAWTQSREEADSLRAVTTNRLGEILDSHKEMRADESRHTRGYQDQVRALEEEGKSLRKMLNEAGQRVDAAEMGVSHHRSKARELEAKVQSLRAELRTSRTKLLSAQAEVTKYKDVQVSRDGEIKEKEMALTDLETRCTVLRNLLADHGIAVADSDLENAETPSTRELETQLRDRGRAHEAAQREIEDLRLRCEEAEDKVESLGRLVERIKDARSPTAASMRSPTPTGDSDRRVGELEKRLVDMEKEHREKVKAVESDYQTAVRYVKGTEKMLKRMKDELNKQKATNATLQTELDNVRGQPGSRTRDLSGRSTPSSSEGELQRKLSTLQHQHQKLQEDFNASQDVLNARNREVELLRMRVEETERECEGLREDLEQARQRIQTLLEVGVVSDDDDDDEEGGSEEASMAFDKFTKELKQWERSRSPGGSDEDEADGDGNLSGDDTIHMPMTMPGSSAPLGIPVGGTAVGIKRDERGAGSGSAAGLGHRRNSSEYSGDWVQ